MTDKIEIQGKTVDAAVSEALLQMGARRDEVEIKVLEEPKSGFLGMLGGRPARVLVRKKRGRRGGTRQDHRREEDGYQFGSGGDRSRGGRGRRGGGGRKDDKEENKRDARGGRDSGRDSGRDGGRDSGRDDSRRGGRGRGRRNDKQDVRADEQNSERRDSGRDGGRDSARNDGERKPTRRGSRGGRGRGGRGRKQDAVAQDQQNQQNQNQNQNQNQDQSQPAQDRKPRGEDRQEQRQSRSRRGQRDGGRRDDARQDDRRGDSRNDRQDDRRNEQGNDQRQAAPVEDRQQQRQERSRRDRRPAAEVAPNENQAPVQETPRDERPVREDVRSEARSEPKVQSVSEVHPIRRAADVKKDTPDAAVPAKPGKKRGFGGLGARRKAKLESDARRAETREVAARQAEEARTNDTSDMDAAAARAKENPGQIRRKEAPEDMGGSHGTHGGTDRPTRERAPRGEMRSTREPGDEVIIADVEATSYAKPVSAPKDEAALETLEELTTGMLARAGFQCDVETRPDEYSQVIVSTDEDNAGMLIGRHGQSVEAVEHLVERMASNAAGDRVRMNLDINEYRVRRQESLLERTREVCDEVLDSGRAYHMEPMSARERRIVHMGCADVEGIRTFTMMGSRGKQVVIAADDGEGETPADEPVFTDE